MKDTHAWGYILGVVAIVLTGIGLRYWLPSIGLSTTTAVGIGVLVAAVGTVLWHRLAEQKLDPAD